MTHPKWIAGVGLAVLLGIAHPAMAQFYPRVGAGAYNGYGGWGGYGGATQYNTTRDIHAQNQQLGQQAAMGQNMVVQSGIRNTLSTQAQTQTNNINSQRQANQDWWFQYQAQQMSQQRAQGPAPAASGSGFEPPGQPAPPPCNMDIIKWPAALQDPAYAYERSQIEAPYRRSPPALSAPTAVDYRDMVKVVQQMDAILEWQTTQGLDTGEYNQAKSFLKKLADEARQRSEPGAAPVKSE